MPALSALRQD
ncbi:uncharacterized protein FFFS_06425 [Fusarium fujikuroi]|nr:uncharacterized protein FFFS_06425 [Fusarium fujikuroi]